jgi:hypothetical protein
VVLIPFRLREGSELKRAVKGKRDIDTILMSYEYMGYGPRLAITGAGTSLVNDLELLTNASNMAL